MTDAQSRGTGAPFGLSLRVEDRPWTGAVR